MILDYEPGDKVLNPANNDWGIGQVQSIIDNKPPPAARVTSTFSFEAQHGLCV